jgi:hypothetical protein
MTHRLLVLAAACVTLAFAGGCRHAEPTAPPPPKVAVSKPVIRDIVEWDEYTGRTQALEAVEVRPRVTGYVHRSSSPTAAEGKRSALDRPARTRRAAQRRPRSRERRHPALARNGTRARRTWQPEGHLHRGAERRRPRGRNDRVAAAAEAAVM